LFEQYVVPSYARFDLVLERGEGSHVWDANGKRYLDLGGGIAVCALGHAHPEITEALIEQSKKLVHTSNLYYTEPQHGSPNELSILPLPGESSSVTAARKRTRVFSNWREIRSGQGRCEIITAFDFISWTDTGRNRRDRSDESKEGIRSRRRGIQARAV